MIRLTHLQIWVVIVLGFAMSFVIGIGVGQATAPGPAPRVVLREGGYHYIDPVLLCNVDSAPQESEDKTLSEAIASYTTKNKADDVSAYFVRFGGKWAGVHINDTYSPASMLKVATLIAVLKYAESHSEFLSKEIYYDGTFDHNAAEHFKPEQTIAARHSYTVDQLLTYMIQYSDNNATELISRTIDPNAFYEIYMALGVQLPSGDNSNGADFMSVKTYALFLRLLYNSTYLTRSMSEKALKLMATTDFPEGIRGGVPSSVEISQKFGEREAMKSDGTVVERELHSCGIVYAPRSPYILCVMTRGQNFESLTQAIHGISTLVYDYVTTGKAK